MQRPHAQGVDSPFPGVTLASKAQVCTRSVLCMQPECSDRTVATPAWRATLSWLEKLCTGLAADKNCLVAVLAGSPESPCHQSAQPISRLVQTS